MRKFFYSLITDEGNRASYVLFRPLLLVFSFIYINAVRLIKFFYKINLLKSTRPESKVISVGNITWGGTGKTSLVSLLARFLDAKNEKCAVLIRGYGSDEDRMLKQQLANTIVLSGKDRLKNAKIAEGKHGAKLLILDDGLQHWRIKRDLDIVAINATNPFGNRKVIPAGILREPLSALKRADIIVVTKANLADRKDVDSIKNIIHDVVPEAEIFEAEHQPVSVTKVEDGKELNPDYIAGKKLCAVAGIGDNNSFFKMLPALDAKLACKLSYHDHHKYTQRDIKDIIDAAGNTNSDAIITTSKDWIRLKTVFAEKNLHDIEVLLLNITVKVANEEKFFNRISSLLNR